jgi:hypothetical protein
MKTYYLHLRAFSCDLCQRPVVTGSTAVRERDIEKETEITPVGAICLSCGHRQSEATAPGRTRDFPQVLSTELQAVLRRIQPRTIRVAECAIRHGKRDLSMPIFPGSFTTLPGLSWHHAPTCAQHSGQSTRQQPVGRK